MATRDITQRISLTGDDVVKKKFEDIGASGAAVFKNIQKAASDVNVDAALTRSSGNVTSVLATLKEGLELVIQKASQLAKSSDLGSGIENLAKSFGVVAAGATAASVGIIALTKSAVEAIAGSQELSQAAAAIGVSTKQYELLAAAMKEAGLTAAATKLTLTLAAEAVSRTGVDQQKAAIQLAEIVTKNISGLNNAVGVRAVSAFEQLRTAAQNTAPTIKSFVDEAATSLGRLPPPLFVVQNLLEKLGKNNPEIAKLLTSLGQAVPATSFAEVFARNIERLTPDLKNMGINLLDASGKVKTLDEALPLIADKFQSLPNGVEKTALAISIFGRTFGPSLIEPLSKGRDGLEEVRKTLEKTQSQFTAEQRKLAEDTKAAFGEFSDLSKSTEEFKNRLGLAFAPAVLVALTSFNNLLKDSDGSIKKLILSMAGDAASVVKSFIEALSGKNEKELEAPWVVRWIEAFRGFGNTVSLVYTNVLRPALTGLIALADGVAAAINGVFDLKVTGGQVALVVIATAIGGALVPLLGIVALLAPALVAAGAALQEFVSANAEPLKALATLLEDQVLGAIKDVANAVRGKDADIKADWVLTAKTAIIDFVGAVRGAVTDVLIPLFVTIKTGLDGVAFAINAVFGTQITGTQLGIAGLALAAIGALTPLLALLDALILAGGLLVKTVVGVFTVISLAAGPIGVIAVVVGLATAALALWVAAWVDAKGGITAALASIVQAVDEKLFEIRNSIRQGLGIEPGENVFGWIERQFEEAINSLIGKIKNLLPKVAQAILETLPLPGAGIANLVAKPILDGLDKANEEARAKAAQIPKTVQDEVNKSSGGVKLDIFSSIADTLPFVNSIKLGLQLLSQFFTVSKAGAAEFSDDMKHAIETPFTEAFKTATDDAREQWQIFADTVKNTDFGALKTKIEEPFKESQVTIFDIFDGIKKRLAEATVQELNPNLKFGAPPTGSIVGGGGGSGINVGGDRNVFQTPGTGSLATLSDKADKAATSLNTLKTATDSAATAESKKTAQTEQKNPLGQGLSFQAKDLGDAATFLALQQELLQGLTGDKESGLSEAGQKLSTAAEALQKAATDLASAAASATQAAGAQSQVRSTDLGGGTTVTTFSGGGEVTGPGTTRSDSILARLSRGEFVLRASAVQMLGLDVLRAWNALANVPRFEAGGLVGMGHVIRVPEFRFALPSRDGARSSLSLTIAGGPTISGLTASESAMEQLQRAAALHKIRRAGKRSSAV